ncbi:MAG: nucleotide exchange factor GrpE [Bacteroidales bacterium]|nr:nucleotide exchange factor GrpE [Bacteroidales bacterium]
MKSEEKKNQEQLNTEETQEQTQQQAQEEQGKETIAQETTEETSQGKEKQKGASQKKEKSKKKEGKKSAEDKEKKKEEQEKEQEQKQEEAEAQQEEEKKEEKSDKEKLAELQDKYLRLTAEYDNYRKRTLKEKMELTKSAGEDILKGLLPIMDDFERALQSIDEAGDIQAVKDGVYLIYNKFKDFLNQQGVKEIEAQDKDFDTDKHEAVSKVPAQNEELKGKVVDVVQKGYYLNDKVLRYAKVVVGE